MDEKGRVLDVEKGEIDHHGNEAFARIKPESSMHDERTPSVTLCASPTSTDENAQRLRSSGSSSTKSRKGFSHLRMLIARWRPIKSEDEAEREVTVQKVHLTPFGYPRLAAFLNSDDNFMLYRRFGYLQSRVLLEKQDDLRQLEEALNRLDEEDAEANKHALRQRALVDVDEARGDCMCIRSGETEETEQDNSTRKKKLLRLIEANVKEYGQLLITAQALVAMNKPTSGERCSVRNWMENVEPVKEADASFVQHTEDLVTLRPGREHAWLDAGVERVLKGCGIAFIRDMFRSKETQMKTDGTDCVIYFTRQRIDRLVIVIITVMILALLIVPIWLLYHITAGVQNQRSNATCIGILLVFTLAFSACISLFTRAKRHEILAAAAGYCAVLVVFFGNVNGGFGSSIRHQ